MNKALNFISLAQKAGKVKTGEYLSMKAVKEGTAHLVVIACDTSEKSKSRIIKLCDAFDCKTAVFGSKAELGHFTGAHSKSVICLTDEGFSKALLKLLNQT